MEILHHAHHRTYHQQSLAQSHPNALHAQLQQPGMMSRHATHAAPPVTPHATAQPAMAAAHSVALTKLQWQLDELCGEIVSTCSSCAHVSAEALARMRSIFEQCASSFPCIKHVLKAFKGANETLRMAGATYALQSDASGRVEESRVRSDWFILPF